MTAAVGLRLVGYLRVSTASQAEDGYGLNIQRQAITDWVQHAGHHLTEVFADEGLSGSLSADERPSLREAIRAVRRGDVDGLVVHRLDRLARLLAVQEGTLAVIWQSGGRVFEVGAGEVLRDDPDDPMRTAMRQMAAVFAQLERATIAARMRAGRRVKAAQGGYSGGAPRFGWAAMAHELVPDPAEQAAIRRAQELRAEGLTLRAIADALTVERLSPKRADRWHPESVRRLLLRIDPVTRGG